MKSNENLIKCYCESRKAQTFFTNCLNNAHSLEEKELIYELISQAVESSNKIRNYCSSREK